MKRNGHGFLITALCVLLAFSAYVLLDSFVIVRRLEAAAAPQTVSETVDQTAAAPAALAAAQKAGAADSLETADAEADSDGGVTVSVTQERVGDTTVYLADVRLSSPDQLRTAFAESTYGRNVTEKTSAIAASVDAVLAVNGDFYGAQQSGYVIRDGVLYRSQAKKGAEDLVIYTDGSFGIIREAEITAQELLDSGAREVLSFGPALVENGAIAVSESDEVGRAMASNPRTAIAVLDELHYLFVVSDGRTAESEGLSLYELAEYLQSKGAQTAYNLDGGGSSTMVYQGQVVNNPTSGGRGGTKERSVSDIVYIA